MHATGLGDDNTTLRLVQTEVDAGHHRLDVGRRPREVKSFLDHDQVRLYELIWLRMVASQMESAELERTTADITGTVASPASSGSKRIIDLRATGTVVKFDGFLTLYQEGEDDAAADEEGRRLPEMSARETKRAIARLVNPGTAFGSMTMTGILVISAASTGGPAT